jgi:glycosyltransferase involved in cell wall biosynthesis
MKKKIWIFHHYADPPDGNWTGTYDVYKHLVKKGHSLTVFSSGFNHYSLKDERISPYALTSKANYNGMNFVFVKTFPYSSNNWRRVVNMMSYGVTALWAGLINREKPDVVIGATPHQFCLFAAILISALKKAPFFLELHDLWLELMIDLGMISEGKPVAQVMKWLDIFTYKKATRIFTLWPQMNKYLEKLGIPNNKIEWIPMGIDFDDTDIPDFVYKDSDALLTAVCTARFGPASNVDEILMAAKILQEKGEKRIKIILVGGGPEEGKLHAYARENELKNVEFKGMRPKSEIPGFLKNADICIGGLPDIPNYRKYGTIPTKMIEYLISNCPTIYITTIKKNLVREANAGIVVQPGDPSALADALIQIADMSSEQRAALALNGINYVKKNHDLKKLGDKLESFFLNV